MPLLIVCGYPCSGKSSRAAELAAALTARGRRVALLSEGRLDDAHSSAAAEKTIRAALRSDTARELSQQTLVIADGLNEIKGFRYELFCLARAAKTPHAVLQTAAPVEQCLAWDHARGQLYTSPERVQHLAARFEQPDNRNRWDSPLFIVTAEDPLPVDQLEAALFDRQAPPPLLSTQGQPIAETNFIHDLDRVTQQIISAVMEAQRSAVVGDKLSVPNTESKVELRRTLTLLQLRQVQRQFISYAKLHPVSDVAALARLFVDFINNSQG